MPPSRYPQFAEKAITDAGEYLLPQWSPSGRYLAFIDASDGNNELVVYDTESTEHWVVATGVSTTYFDWDPAEELTYLMHNHERSGSPFPSISELHLIELDGTNDRVIADNLISAGNFAWFQDGGKLAILLNSAGNTSTFCQDAYLLDLTTAVSTLVMSASQVDLDCFSMLALSPDETQLLVYGIREGTDSTVAELVIFNISEQKVVQTIVPSKVIPSGNAKYQGASIEDSPSFGWVSNTHWLLAVANAPVGQCYNYSLYFFNTDDLASSFCIPTTAGIVSGGSISQDATRLAYVTVIGPGTSYVMIGNVTSELRKDLGIVEGK